MFVKYAYRLSDSQYYPEPGDLFEFQYLSTAPNFFIKISTMFDESQKFGLKEHQLVVNMISREIIVNWTYQGFSYCSKGLYKQLSGTIPE